LFPSTSVAMSVLLYPTTCFLPKAACHTSPASGAAEDDQGVLKAVVNVPVADEQPLDDPEGLTGCHEL